MSRLSKDEREEGMAYELPRRCLRRDRLLSHHVYRLIALEAGVVNEFRLRWFKPRGTVWQL